MSLATYNNFYPMLNASRGQSPLEKLHGA